ncbi:MAG: hypothetical protein QOG58_2915 [Caballeronia sp.]|jgi:hypothetical protein|nr:hypothetical protein [Caballeronia sp.]
MLLINLYYLDSIADNLKNYIEGDAKNEDRA